MMMLNNKKNHEDIYEQISSLFKIKFKAQLKDSPLEFTNFCELEDITTGELSYLLIFRNEESIKFKNRAEFIKEFSNYMYCKILEFENQFNALNSGEIHNMKFDENDIFMQHEEIGHGQYKLSQLLKKFKTFKDQ
jgi:hypothetical protein